MDREKNRNEHLAEKPSDHTIDEKSLLFSQGVEETHEQINDTYSSGNNDVTFLRDGKDMAKKPNK